MRVAPVKVLLLAPVRVWVPPLMVKPPVPEMTPEKVPDALVTFRMLLPRVTEPEPLSEVTLTVTTLLRLLMALEISKVPLSTMGLVARVLSDVRLKVAPGEIRVVPV